MKSLKALLFDVDGTLADTEIAHLAAFNRAFEENGLDWQWSQALYLDLLQVTGGKERMLHYIDRYCPGFQVDQPLATWVAELHRCKTRHYVEMIQSGQVPLRPGIRRLMEEARTRGLQLAIVTTTTPANVTALLDNALEPGGEGWFDFIGAGDVVPAKKPAPDIYCYVMEKLALRPEECLALEDSAPGVRSARDAGIETVLVTVNGFTRHQDFSQASLVVDSLGEPDAPCRVLQGPGDIELVDMGVLERIFATGGAISEAPVAGP